MSSLNDCTSLNGSEGKLQAADLNRALLAGADLKYANLSGVSLYGADLSDADLSSSDLFGSDLFGVNLTSAILINTKLAGARGLSEEMLRSVKPSHPPATLPKGLEWPFEQAANGDWKLKE